MPTTTQAKRQEEVTNGSGQITRHKDSSIAQCWYDLAYSLNNDLNDEPNKSVFKFMVYWLAFNFLYAEYNNIITNNKYTKERTAIEKYCGKIKEIIEEANIFNKFQCEVDNLTEKPVISSGSNETEKARENQRGANNKDSDDFTRFQSLIQIIYTVRCNLFHGSKNPADERDYKLVHASAKIMEYLVGKLVKTEQY